MGAAVDGDDALRRAENAGDLGVQVVERVAVLGEDNNLPLPARLVVHLGVVLQQLREFVPLAVLARGDDRLGLPFQLGKDADFRFEFGDGLRRRRLIDELLFERLLLVGVQVVVVLGHVVHGFGAELLGPVTELLVAEPFGESFLPPFERLVDGLRAGGEPPLQRGEGEADRATPLAVQLVGLAHFFRDIPGDRLVERGLGIGQRVVDSVSLPLGKQRRAVELDQFLLHHAPHQVGGIDLVNAVTELAVEAVGVEQGEEQLEVLLLAVVRCSGHQQQVPRLLTESLGEAEPAGLLQLRPEEVGSELVGLVEDDQIPPGRAELRLQMLVPRHLVEPNDELMVILERVARWRRFFQRGREDSELQAEFLEQFVPPLLDEAARRDDQHPPSIGPHDQFADVEARHDGLARAGVVGQDEAQRLTRQHRLVDGGDLVRQRLDVGGVDGHHRIEQKRQVDPLGLAGENKLFPVAVNAHGRSTVATSMVASSAIPSSRSLMAPSGRR